MQQEEHDFIDWGEEFANRGYSAPVENVDTRLPMEERAIIRTSENGYPVFVYGRRTGYGCVVHRTLWRRLVEKLRAPEMWLRRLFIVSWVLVAARSKDIKTKRRRRKLWYIQLPHGPDKITPSSRAIYLRPLPVLTPRLVSRIPKWAMKLLVRMRLVQPMTSSAMDFFYAKGTLFAYSDTGVTMTAEHGIYNPWQERLLHCRAAKRLSDDSPRGTGDEDDNPSAT